MELVSFAAYQYGHNQRSACKSQLSGCRHSGKYYRQAAEEYAEEYAEEQRAYVGHVKAFFGVSQTVCQAFYGVFRSYHPKTVAYLNAQVAACEQFYARTCDARYVNAVNGAEVHLAERLSVHFRLGYYYAA